MAARHDREQICGLAARVGRVWPQRRQAESLTYFAGSGTCVFAAR